MKSFNSILLAALFAAISIPAAAFAATDEDTTGVVVHRGEIGTVDHTPFKGTKSRAEVKKELDVAHKAGTHQMGGEVTVVTPEKATVTKSQAQVRAELDAAHKAGTHQMGGEVTVVAPDKAAALSK